MSVISIFGPHGHGHYELMAEAGRGGMGVVWHARDLKLKMDAALKFAAKAPAGK